MTFKFTVKFCSPKRSKIIYDKTSARLATVPADAFVGKDGYCVFYSPTNKLSFHVRTDSGEIDGLEIYIGDLDKLPTADITIKDSFDGCVNIAGNCGKLTADTKYMFNFNSVILYDCANSIVYIGSYVDNCMTVRICENAFIAVNEQDELCGVAIKL